MQLFPLGMEAEGMIKIYQVPKSILRYIQGVLIIPTEVVSLIIEV